MIILFEVVREILTLSGCKRATFLTIRDCAVKVDRMSEHPYIPMTVRTNKHSRREMWRNKNKNMIYSVILVFQGTAFMRHSIMGFHFLRLLLFQPLGASDYLEISKHFDTVFVRDIPLLTMAKRTQARRFITLIDTFYEHKVRISLSCMCGNNTGSPKTWLLYFIWSKVFCSNYLENISGMNKHCKETSFLFHKKGPIPVKAISRWWGFFYYFWEY